MRQISKRAKVMSGKPAYDKKEKSESGGTIYRYKEDHIKKRWNEKLEKLKKLEKDIKKVRAQYEKDLKSDDGRTRAIACVVGVIDATSIRVGNPKSVEEHNTYGATTLKVKHVSFSGSKARLKFVGKSQVKQDLTVDNAKVVSVLKELVKGKGKDDFVFEVDGKRIWDRAVNRYLSDFDISAKDIRGFHANRLMKEKLKKKDFKDALKEVAETVGHEESTLKNQYLDPELVKKHEKKASISVRADETLPANRSPENDWKQMLDTVDIDRNVGNISRSAKFDDQSIQMAWRIIAPFLPNGATLTNAFRSEHDQSRILIEYWRSWGRLIDYKGNAVWANKWSPAYSGFFHTTYANELGITSAILDHIYRKSVSGKYPLTRKEKEILETLTNAIRTKPMPQWLSRPEVAAPGESLHQEGIAFDVGGADLQEISKNIMSVAQLFPESIQLSREPLVEGKANKVVHVVLARSVSMPRMEDYVPALYNAQSLSSQKIVMQTAMYPISKRAELTPEDQQWINSIKPGISHRTNVPTTNTVTRKNVTRVRPGVKLNNIILNAWFSLLPFLPRGAIMTSGERTASDQKRILSNYWYKLTGQRVSPSLSDDDKIWWQISRMLRKNYGYIVGPPITKSNYSHLKGNAFDVSGADLDEIASAVVMVSDSSIPVVFRKPLIEYKNNAVHVGVVSAQYDQKAIENVLKSNGRFASLSKRATEESDRDEQIREIYEDLIASNPPDDVVEEFENVFNVGMHCTADVDIEDFGLGIEDEPGDWFEKLLRHTDDHDFDIHDVGESEAKKLCKEDPEQFFYRGLHKDFEELEPEALENLIEKSPKFYFVFKCHERDDDKYKNLLEKASEKLSLLDPRAFFYYHLHHKFPELGRGAVVHLIDKDPRSFVQLGLNKDYPDYEQMATDAINIYDPTVVDVKEVWASNKLSKRSGVFVLNTYYNANDNIIFPVFKYNNGKLLKVGNLAKVPRRHEIYIANKIDSNHIIIINAEQQI